MEDKPFTRRGVLSMVNSIFDPLGFIAPITITGKILLRDVTPSGIDWDMPLSYNLEPMWIKWKHSIQNLRTITIPRSYTSMSYSGAKEVSVLIFSDASEKAIAAVSYLRLEDEDGHIRGGFLLGKAKLAPATGHSIPRLELCAAVLAVELAETINTQLDIPVQNMTLFTDSKVVLGYICNKTRRFFTYVSNRVERILNITCPEQWRYVQTDKNPADFATRCTSEVPDINDSVWIKGPTFLLNQIVTRSQTNFDLVNPDNDCEIRHDILVKKTIESSHFIHKFEKFSTWKSLIRALSLLTKVCVRRRLKRTNDVAIRTDVETCVIRTVQESVYSTEINLLKKGQNLPTSSKIICLSPYLDDQGILRVTGRIKMSPLCTNIKHPIIVPPKCHVALLLVRHFHENVHHQGRLLTEATIRNNGFWIIGAKRLVSSVIHKCVTCRRLRGKFQTQYMANLPADRVTPCAPFTFVGVDTFGPWNVVARKTRGGHSESKRWALLFTCLSTRAAHIEVIQEMTSSSFINALRRFVAIRGPVKEFRSDQGTNFVGAIDSIGAQSIFVEHGPVNNYLLESKIVWKFNPPHASHFGGAWERLIGLARRILDAMLLNSHGQKLTHEVLCTFMCEVSAIMNSRPISPISSDPDNPEIISPGMLLTQKCEQLDGICSSTDLKDIYKYQWKYVQVLSNTFWKQWKNGYLQMLQKRSKWYSEQPNLKCGDIVVIKNTDEHRNHWPLGVIKNVFKSDTDSKIRSVEVSIYRDGRHVNYVRPISQLVLLVE
ncbi:hypothetical protein ACF0H5_015190 [Mactra antiquata]